MRSLIKLGLIILFECAAAQPSMKDVQVIFRNMDRNGDGRVTFAEYFEAGKKTDASSTQEKFKIGFDHADLNGDDKLDTEEFAIHLGGPSSTGVTLAMSIPENPAPNGLAELRLIITITNQGDQPIKGTKLKYSGRGFDNDGILATINSVEPGGKRNVEVTLTSKWHMDIDMIPEAITIDLARADGTIITRINGQTDLAWFTGALGPPTFQPSDFNLRKFNVLIFGPKGSGKSAFINSVHAMSQRESAGEAMPKFVPEHGGADHCTVRYNEIEGLTDLPLAFWDTWGVSPERYNGNELELIMTGKLPAGWEMDENVALAAQTDDLTAEENRPHAVIFMLPVNWLGDPDSEQMQKITKEFTKLKRLGVNPLVLLARIDEIDPDIRANPGSPGEASKNAISGAAKLLGIAPADVIPNVNYLEETKKSFKIDRNLWTILHRVLSQSKHYLKFLDRSARQEEAQRNPTSVSPMRAKIYKLEQDNAALQKRADDSDMTAKKYASNVQQLKGVKQQLENQVAKLEKRVADAESWASGWRTLCTALVAAILVAIALKNPSGISQLRAWARVCFGAGLSILKSLVAKAEEQLGPVPVEPEPRPPAPAAATESPQAVPSAPVAHDATAVPAGSALLADSFVRVPDSDDVARQDIVALEAQQRAETHHTVD